MSRSIPPPACTKWAAAPQPLRQGGGRGGDDGPRRRVGEELEREGAAHHRLAEGPAVAGAPGPPPPVTLRPRQGGVGLGAERRQHRGPLAGVDQGEACRLAGAQPGGTLRPALARAHRPVGAKREEPRARLEPQPEPPRVAPPAAAEAEVGPQVEGHLHRHLPRLAGGDPQELVLRLEQPGLVRLVQHRHAVGHPEHAAVGAVDRLEDVRAGEVAPGRAGRSGRREPPAPGLRVEQAAEHRRAVEARPAEPVHHARPRDQRRGAAVADEGVVLDGRGGAHSGPGAKFRLTGCRGNSGWSRATARPARSFPT